MGAPSSFYSPRQKEMGTTQPFKNKASGPLLALSIVVTIKPLSVTRTNVYE